MSIRTLLIAPLRRWYVFAPSLALVFGTYFLARAILERPIHEATTTLEVRLPQTRARDQGRWPPAAQTEVVYASRRSSSLVDIVARCHDRQLADTQSRAAAKALCARLAARARVLIEKSQAELEAKIDRAARELEILDRSVASLEREENRRPGARAVAEEIPDLRTRAGQVGERLARLKRGLSDVKTTDPVALAERGVVVAGSSGAECRLASRPAPGFLVAFSGVGLFLAWAAAFALERADTRFRSSSDLRERLRLDVLGSVPQVSGPHGDLTPANLPREARQSVAECASRLRQFAAATEMRSVAITSALPEEGRTTTAANLAAALAEEGLRVILIDAEVLRPRLHFFFALQSEAGFLDLLGELRACEGEPSAYVTGMEDARFLSVAAGSGVPGLRVVRAGEPGAGAAERLTGVLLRPLILRFCRLADIVIVDAPALSSTPGAAQLAAAVDGCLLVVRAGFSAGHQVEWARRRLFEVQANIAGVLLNWGQPDKRGESLAGAAGVSGRKEVCVP